MCFAPAVVITPGAVFVGVLKRLKGLKGIALLFSLCSFLFALSSFLFHLSSFIFNFVEVRLRSLQ